MTNSPSSMLSQLNLKNSSLNKTIKLILFKNIENYLYYLYWDLIYSLPEISQQIDFINNNVLHLLDIFCSWDRSYIDWKYFSSSLQDLYNLKNYHQSIWRRSKDPEDLTNKQTDKPNTSIRVLYGNDFSTISLTSFDPNILNDSFSSKFSTSPQFNLNEILELSLTPSWA